MVMAEVVILCVDCVETKELHSTTTSMDMDVMPLEEDIIEIIK
jgi:hypothetical protein